jgi:hypothetical protein
MRHRLLITAGILVLLAGAVLGYAALTADRLIRRLKPDVERLASERLGAPVTLGDLAGSVFPAARIVVRAVRVGGELGMSVDRLVVRVRLLGLLRGRLDVVKVELQEPRLVLVRGAGGVRVAGWPVSASPAGTARSATGASETGFPVLPAVSMNVHQLAVRDGSIELQDAIRKVSYGMSALAVDAQGTADAREVRLSWFRSRGLLAGVTEVGAAGSDLSYRLATGRVDVPGLILDVAGSPLRLRGSAEIRVPSAEVHLVSDGIDLAPLEPLWSAMLPGTRALALRGVVRPDLTGRFALPAGLSLAGKVGLAKVSAALPAGTITNLRGTIELAAADGGASASAEGLALSFAEAPVTASFAAALDARSVVHLRRLEVKGFAGVATSSGTLDVNTARFTAEVEGRGFDAGALLAVLRPGAPPPITGTVAHVRARLAGDAGPKALASLSGPGSLVLERGRLAGVNLVTLVLKAARDIPLVGPGLEAATPAPLRPVLADPDTVITRFEARGTAGSGAFGVESFTLTNPTFTLDGSGRVGLDGRLELRPTLRLSADVSRAIVERAREAAVLLDGKDQVAVPITVSGMLPAVVVVPDAGRLLGAPGTAIERGAEELLRGLRKLKLY